MENRIKVHDKYFKVMLSSEQIQTRIKEVCAEMNERYQEKRPIFLAILNGSFALAGDVMKYIDIECEISFVKLKSYMGDRSTGKVKQLLGLDANLANRDVVILEDIVDTGETMLQFLPTLLELKPKTVAIFTLLLKPGALKYPLNLDYTGFEIDDRFVVGYGLDYDGLGRNLNDIYQLAPSED